MAEHPHEINRPLDWDSEFFGVTAYKTTMTCAADVDRLAEAYASQTGRTFYTAINVNNRNEINRKMTETFGKNLFLADINLSFWKSVGAERPLPETDGFTVTITNSLPYEPEVVRIAGNFIYSRFFNDTRLGEKRFDIYRSWVTNAFDQPDRYYVLARAQERVLGFILFSFNADQSVTIELLAVDEAYRGKHVGTVLMQHLERFLHTRRVEKYYVGTQVSNIAAINFYFHNGFQIYRVNSIYHLWK